MKKGKTGCSPGMTKDDKGATFVKKGGMRASARALPSMPKGLVGKKKRKMI